MKITISLLFVLIFSLAAFGQSKKSKPCSANLLKAEIHGFSTGTSKEAVSKVLTNIKWKTLEDGTEIASHTNFTDRQRFGGVWYMNFSLYENVLFHIEVAYDKSVKLKNIVSFTNNISKNWSITDKWKGAELLMTIECTERYVLVTAAKTLYLQDSQITDKIIRKDIEKRKNGK